MLHTEQIIVLSNSLCTKVHTNAQTLFRKGQLKEKGEKQGVMSKYTKSKISIEHYFCVYGDSNLTSGIKTEGP